VLLGIKSVKKIQLRFLTTIQTQRTQRITKVFGFSSWCFVSLAVNEASCALRRRRASSP
jgi:hypothetical protein